MFNGNKLECFLSRPSNNERVNFFNVKGDDISQQYTLVKILEQFNEEHWRNSRNSSVIQPVFVIKNKEQGLFGAYENNLLNNFVLAETNDLAHIRVILKTLATWQANILTTTEETTILSEYDIKAITENIITLKYFNEIEKAKIGEIIQNLQSAFNKLLEPSLLVETIWSPSANNVYVRKDGAECVFLKVSSQKLLPPSYDALLYIFSLSNEQFRQNHFEHLIFYYFESLVEALHNSKISGRFTREFSELQVRTLLPIVKFKIAKDSHAEELLANIANYLRYPLIHQEDVYEATRNKLSSSDYQLLNFTLVPLNHKNGHLGEYFHLNIKVNFQNAEENLKLFAKFVIAETDNMQDILDRGAGLKEDGFYKVLYPLYRSHGLESLLDFAPRCYLSRISWLLVLDDLGSMGFIGLKPNATFNYNELRVIIGKIAKMHACSLIVEEIMSKQQGKEVRLGDEYAEYMQETLLNYDGPLKAWWFDSTLTALRHLTKKFPELINASLNHLSPSEIDERFKTILFSPLSKVRRSDKIRNIVNHGDMHAGNMLFQFGKDKLVEDGILIDFQMLRYVSSTYEVIFFITLSSTKETRDKYLMPLLDDYYKDMSMYLINFNLDPAEVYPRKLFDDDIKHSKSAALGTAFSYAHWMHIDPDIREGLFVNKERSKYYMEDHKDELIDISWKIEHYRNIMKGLLQDFIELAQSDF